MELKEKVEICSKLLLTWGLEELENPKMKYDKDDEEFIQSSFISKILIKKFDAFGIKIHLPMFLLAILSTCTEENPGMSQIILKDLLLNIKDRRGPIPEGYVITAMDFGMCFMHSFPIMDIKSIEEKYEKLWDGQKYQTAFGSNNLCDTVDWWKEVML